VTKLPRIDPSSFVLRPIHGDGTLSLYALLENCLAETRGPRIRSARDRPGFPISVHRGFVCSGNFFLEFRANPNHATNSSPAVGAQTIARACKLWTTYSFRRLRSTAQPAFDGRTQLGLGAGRPWFYGWRASPNSDSGFCLATIPWGIGGIPPTVASPPQQVVKSADPNRVLCENSGLGPTRPHDNRNLEHAADPLHGTGPGLLRIGGSSWP